MARTMIFVLAVFALIPLVFAAPSRDLSDLSPVLPETHTFGDMVFDGSIHGVEFQANGTVEPRGWVGAQTDKINDGVNYLIWHAGNCGVGARSCVRIKPHGIALSCVYLASYARGLIYDCSWWDSAHDNWTCRQEFDTDYYNAIVHYNDHNC
ncbi:hypothetical protein BDZ45DRAFT_742794 [Acephala macrosclerotiorum]|nr:hypothetical protein BDZ45DRAFT_742794 [Acephala macrosclerotiorum]